MKSRFRTWFTRAAALTLPLLVLLSTQTHSIGLLTTSRPHPQSSSSSSSGGGGDATFLSYAQMPLTLKTPRPPGTGGYGVGSGLDSRDRVFKQYPGIEYNVPVMITGGKYPYVCSITSGAGTGMVMESWTSPGQSQEWRIRWPDPQADATPTFECEDGDNDTVGATYTIDVTTTGFKFVDSVNDGSGDTGAIGAPFDSLAQAKAGSVEGDILIFRAGNYVPTATAGTSGAFTCDRWNSDAQSVQWLAYPGETVNINHGYLGAGVDVPCVEFNSNSGDVPPYIDGFVFNDSKDKGIYFGHYTDYGYTAIRNIFDGSGPGTESNNSGVITMRDHIPDTRYGSVLAFNTFRNIDTTLTSVFKAYNNDNAVWHGNFLESGTGTGTEGMAIKADVSNISVRGNRSTTNWNGPSLAGNMNFVSGAWQTSGEVSFNNFAIGAGDYCVTFNQNTNAGHINFFNNTFRCSIYAINVTTEDGPFHFDRNIFINPEAEASPWPGLFEYTDGVTRDATRVTYGSNIFNTSATGILDSDGELTGSYITTNGPGTGTSLRGHRWQ